MGSSPAREAAARVSMSERTSWSSSGWVVGFIAGAAPAAPGDQGVPWRFRSPILATPRGPGTAAASGWIRGVRTRDRASCCSLVRDLPVTVQSS